MLLHCPLLPYRDVQRLLQSKTLLLLSKTSEITRDSLLATDRLDVVSGENLKVINSAAVEATQGSIGEGSGWRYDLDSKGQIQQSWRR